MVEQHANNKYVPLYMLYQIKIIRLPLAKQYNPTVLLLSDHQLLTSAKYFHVTPTASGRHSALTLSRRLLKVVEKVV